MSNCLCCCIACKSAWKGILRIMSLLNAIELGEWKLSDRDTTTYNVCIVVAKVLSII